LEYPYYISTALYRFEYNFAEILRVFVKHSLRANIPVLKPLPDQLRLIH
jgi:hypothetical protein